MKSQKLSAKFNMESLKKRGLTLLIEHAPCCILAFGAGFIGMSTLRHNPILELGFALGGAIIGEYIGHKYFCDSSEKKKLNWQFLTKRYGFALMLGVASWSIHQAIFHEDHKVQDICQHHQHHNDTPQQRPFFGSPEMKKRMDERHARIDEVCKKRAQKSVIL